MTTRLKQFLDHEIEGFRRIEIDAFMSEHNCAYDIYLRINKEKILKILTKGDEFSYPKLKKYKENYSIKYLFVTEKDYTLYRNTLRKNVLKMSKAKLTNTNLIFIDNYFNLILDEIDTHGIDEIRLNEANKVIDSTIFMVKKNKDLLSLLMNSTDITHGFMTTLYSILIVEMFEWSSRSIEQSVALGAMLHDIGKNELPFGLRSKKYEQMDQLEKKEFEKHPIYSFEILSKQKDISDLTLQIVSQHHEYQDGSGYPRGLRKGSISLPSAIVSFANSFSELVADQRLSLNEAIEWFNNENKYPYRFAKEILENFIKSLSK